MTTTGTVPLKSRLVYALPTAPPIPFAARPSYPIRLATRDLGEAYTAVLWPDRVQTRADELVSLDSFARLLISVLHDKSAAEANALFRQHILPLQAFDRRWRSEVPSLIPDEEDELLPTPTDSAEALRVRKDYDRWAAAEKLRLEEERRSRKHKGKQRASEQDGEQSDSQVADLDDAPGRVRPDDWIEAKELLETRLQALLLLGLLSLPVTFQPDRPKKGKKKRTPELFAETLDAAMLLDFQTDRMQIWRVMQEVSELNVAAAVAHGEETAGEKEIKALAPQKDLVQEWWVDIVEPNFRTRVDGRTLSHHRIKLFPASTSQADRLAQRLEPAPSPFKARSLLSLENSARKREAKAGERRIAESPTMKRLLRKADPTAAREPTDVFKIPSGPSSRRIERAGDKGDGRLLAAEPDRPPRDVGHVDRSRPLPRGDSTAGATEVLKRRVVSLAKKPATRSSAPSKPNSLPARKAAHDFGDTTMVSGKRKRKSSSPKKLDPASQNADSLFLVPNTPDKVSASASAPFRNPFAAQASPVPSFASLGAAFRAGVTEPDAPLPPFRLPSPPSDRARAIDTEPVPSLPERDKSEDRLRVRDAAESPFKPFAEAASSVGASSRVTLDSTASTATEALQFALKCVHDKARHELDCMDLRAENASLRSKLEKAAAELDAAYLEQEVQQQACALLMEEQEHLEVAYEEALAEIEILRQAISGPEVPLAPPEGSEQATDQTDSGVGDTSWELLPEALSAPSRATIQRTTRRRLLSRMRRTAPKPAPSGDSQTSREQLALSTVRNELEQMKSSIAMLVRDREHQEARTGGGEGQQSSDLQ